jgi:DNA-binding FrmR family transcriptional regulator
MQLENEHTKRELSLRLKRLEGQIRGIEAMVSDERNCEEILQQLTAVKSATDRVTEIYLQRMLEECLAAPELPGDPPKTEVMGRLVHLILAQ